MDTLPKLVDNINKEWGNYHKNISFLTKILKDYNGKDWSEYIINDTSLNYIKKLVYENDNYEVFVVSWMPNGSSTIHDHSENGCVFKILKGTLIEDRYDPKTIKYKGSENYNTNEVAYICNESCYHKVNNIEDKVTVSLNIYSPPKYQIKSYITSTT